MNIGFVGGGSGGHIFPIRSLIQHAHNNGFDKNCKLFWFGEKGKLEEKVAKECGVFFVGIISGKRRREKSLHGIIKNIGDIGKVFIGILLSVVYLKKYRIQKLFSKGGFVSVPVVIAASLCRIPIICHESDKVVGVANKIAARFATVRLSTFDMEGYQYVGPIISDDIVRGAYEYEEKNAPDSGTHILVIGGSQGSKTLIEAVLEMAENFPSLSFHIILGTLNSAYTTSLPTVSLYPFVSPYEMGRLLARCDIAITRGSSAMFEQKLCGLRLCIIPLPYTGGNHQYYNGLYFEKQYRDTLILQNEKMKILLEEFLKNHQTFKKTTGVDTTFITNVKDTICKKIFFE